MIHAEIHRLFPMPINRVNRRLALAIQRFIDDHALSEIAAAGGNRAVLHAGCLEQPDGFRLELRVYSACAVDGLDVSRQPRDVAGAFIAGHASIFLLVDHRVGVRHHDPRVVGTGEPGTSFARAGKSLQC